MTFVLASQFHIYLPWVKGFVWSSKLQADNSMLVMVNGYEIMSVVRLVPYLVPILFSLIIVVGSVGNILVVLVVVMNKTMRNNTNILILNLAVSPIL